MKKPTEAEIARAIALISRSYANYRYFFETLKDPGWLDPLAAAGFFTRPEEPVRSGDQVTIPFWPESGYLARIATQPDVQERVAELCLALATDNSRIHEDLAAVALALPTSHAVRFVAKAERWLQSPYKARRLVDRLAELLVRLSDAGDTDPALSLARSLFGLVEPQPTGDAAGILRPKAVTIVGTWEYGRALRVARPRLIKAAGLTGMQVFLDLLTSALVIGRREGDDAGDDYSYVWYPVLDSTPDEDARELLVGAVRDSAEELVAADPDRLPHVVGLLQESRWTVCRRLALHLLRLHPHDMALIGSLLAQAPDSGLRREYELLAADKFSAIDPALRAQRLAQISEPSVQRIRESHLAFFGEELPEEEARHIADARLRDELAPLVGGLDAKWRVRFEALVAELGPPPAPGTIEPVARFGTGPASPRNFEDLRGADVHSVIEYLRTWEPGGSDPLEPSREGLARTLSSVVAERPGDFASHAHAFSALDPTYVRALIDGLWDAARNGRAFPWPPVIDLASWVLAQPRDIPGRRGGHLEGQDPSWRWARTSVARLAEAGFNDSPAVIPFELKNAVASLLSQLVDDDPADAEREPPADDADLTLIAMNTTSGEAVRASLALPFWARRQRADFCLDEDPECSALLDRPLRDFGPTSWSKRSVYGANLPKLLYYEPRWARARLEALLPRAPEQSRARAAVWEDYLLWAPAYDFMLDVLREHYADGVAALADDAPTGRRRRDLEHRLIEHLCLYYGRGLLDLTEASLPAKALTKPRRADLRRHALEFIGRSLGHSEDVPAETLRRFQAFWAWFRSLYAASPESAAFGWWLVSNRFSTEWWLEEAVGVLTHAKSIDPLYTVLEHLLAPAADHSAAVLRILSLVVEGDGPESSLWGLEHLARPIFERILRSSDERARVEAARLINRLGHLGYSSFRDLLRQ